MDRHIEVFAHLEMRPETIIELLNADPAAILTGTGSADHGSFVASIAVEVAGGTTLAHDVDVVFGQLLSDGDVARYGVSWRPHGHEHLFPIFGGDLEAHPEVDGTRLRLAGYYTRPLGAVGAFGDGLVGHRVARRALQGFLDDAAARLAVTATNLVGAGATVPARTERQPHSELYIG